MKILVVTPLLPHSKVLHAGGKAVYWTLLELAREHEVSLLTRLAPDEVGYEGDVEALCHEVRKVRHDVPVASTGRVLERVGTYVKLGLGANRWMRETRFDLVLIEHVEAGFVMRAPAGVPMIMDAQDVITKPQERIFRAASGKAKVSAWLTYRATRLVETHVLRKCAVVLVKSEADREYLQKTGISGGVPLRVFPVPCGLDASKGERADDGRTVAFLGALHRTFNIQAVEWFARQVFPLIRRRVRDAVFQIAGANAPESLGLLAQEVSGVQMIGKVDDIGTVFRVTTVFVAPLLVGGGVIVKVLDAMAAGVPVVATPFGNEGVRAESGRDVLVASDPAEFAECVIKLLEDRDLNMRMGANGKAFVLPRFGPEVVAAALRKDLQAIMANAVGHTQ